MDEEAPKANAEDTLEQRTSRGSMTPLSKHRSLTGSLTNVGPKASDIASTSGNESQSIGKLTQKPAPTALRIAAKQVTQHTCNLLPSIFDNLLLMQ